MSNVTAAADTPAPAANRHRDDILSAAIKIFGKYGYTAASTNEIVKLANVSKGLLFHYFSSKEKLYVACQLQVMDKYGEYMTENIKLNSKDFFERILQNLKIKLEFGRLHPDYLVLINHAFYIESEENMLSRKAAEEYILNSALGGKQLNDFFAGVNTSCFRDGVDTEKLLDYTRLVMEASWQRFSRKCNNDPALMVNDMDDFYNEAEEILVLLKHGAYI